MAKIKLYFYTMPLVDQVSDTNVFPEESTTSKKQQFQKKSTLI